MATAQLDVMFGGGRRYFAAEARRDGRDLLGILCARSTCLSSAAELAAYRPDARPVVGLFTPGDMDATDTRPAELTAMVAQALAKLALDPDGFVVLFETEATDNATHANAPLDRITADILEFDRAVGVALDFARRTPGTLPIVTADHETGGMALAETADAFELRYTTGGHSAAHVPLFAYGARAGMFGGLKENYEVGRMLFGIVRGW